jgi:hypothetical protein
MQAVYQMKPSPLRTGERPEDWMVEQFAPQPKVFLAARNAHIHFADFPPDLG